MRTALISTLGVMLMLSACAKPPSQTRNACAIFEQRDGLFNNWRRAVALVLVTLSVGAGGWLLRSWVPPATLWMTEVAVSTEVMNRQPGDSLDEIAASRIRSSGLYAYTAINAPRGLNERIYHVWQKDGQEVDRIALDIHGGRKEGYRAWTHKQNFPPNPVGKWQVRVLTEDGQVIGVLRFKVVNDAPAGS